MMEFTFKWPSEVKGTVQVPTKLTISSRKMH